MFANSISVILLGIVISVPALLLLIWAFKHRQFDDLNESSMVIFDEEELRYTRPWEKPEQVQERLAHYGSPLPNALPEWRKWL